MLRPPLKPTASVETIRKSERIGLSFPYDWSNPAISDEALILNVLARGIYKDICRICAHFGLHTVEALRAELPEDVASGPSMIRMLDNIKTGFARAQTR
jgi:hypothetical protein